MDTGKINLGYPDCRLVDKVSGSSLLTAWFWKDRGNSCVPYSRWTSDFYENCKKSNFEVDLNPGLLDMLGVELYLDFCTLDKSKYFNLAKYRTFLDLKQPFFVPITITSFTGDYLKYLQSVKLPEDLRKAIIQGKAKVLFFSHKEGTVRKNTLEFVQVFCKNHGFCEKDVVVTSSNLNRDVVFELGEKPLFSYEPVNYFEIDPWFLDYPKENRTFFDKVSTVFLQENEQKVKDAKILCLSRRKTSSRVFLTSFLRTLNRTKVSQGLGYSFLEGSSGFDFLHCVSEKESLLRSRYYENVKQFLSSIGSEKATVAFEMQDTSEMLQDRGIKLPLNLYRNAYLSVIPETFYDEEPSIRFVTEKTFKAIYCCQPFILFAEKGTLKCLQDLGYKTFDRWWDESYDNIEDPTDRLDKVCMLAAQLASKEDEELRRMLVEMKSVLYHNFTLFVSTARLSNFLSYLKDFLERKEEKA